MVDDFGELQQLLAIGFGGERIAKILVGPIKDIEARALADTDSRFCAGLVPVDFNAWHYAETNLWASLFVHILEELGERLNSGRDRGSPMQQRGRVLAQIGRTYAQLRDAEADAAHADAEAVRFRKLQEMTREEGKNSALVTTLLGAVKETLSWNEGSYRPLEDAAAPAYQAAEKRLGELEVEINEFGEIGSNIFTIIRRAIHLPFWQIFWLGLGTATMLVSMLLISYDAFDTTIMRQLASLASGLFVTIGAIVAWLGTYRRWLKQGVDKLRSALSKQEARELRDKASELQRFRDQETQATARAASERERSLALQSQLTELEAQAKALEPRRRLAEFVAYRAESESYRSLLGIPAMIRNDIDQLTTYLQDITWEEGQIPIKRIILFVDDLDRCAPDVVVRVLEAVHILLASNLFIIIVGVDPRWLQGALAERFRGLLRVRPSVDGGATPLEFLEKIFQVPFWIPDMTQAGKELLIQQSLPAPRIEKLSQAALTHGGTVEISQERDAEQTASTPNLDESTVPPLPTVQPILLEPEERELLVELASVAGDTPRRLKRFARCYLILRASFTSGQLAELRSSRTYEAAARLLAAANGAPMAWPDFRQDLSRAQLQDAVWDVAERFNSDLPHESEILKNAFSTRDGPTALTVADVFPWISEVSRFTFPAASARLDDISVSPRDTGTLERPSPDLKAEIPEQS
jgi:hypothetical protein